MIPSNSSHVNSAPAKGPRTERAPWRGWGCARRRRARSGQSRSRSRRRGQVSAAEPAAVLPASAAGAAAPPLRWGTAAWAMRTYHVTRSGSAYEPKKARAKTVGEVFGLSASTERGEAAGAFAGSNLGGCFPCPGRGLLARVWVRGWRSGRGWASLREQMNLLWPVLRLAKEMEAFNKKGRLHPSVLSPGVATDGMGGGAGCSLRRGNQGIPRALLSVGRQQSSPCLGGKGDEGLSRLTASAASGGHRLDILGGNILLFPFKKK